MFTGIITATAKVIKAEKSASSLHLEISTPKGWQLKTGDSVAVNGACVTVNRVDKSSWLTILIPATLSVTSFGKNVPKKVNLERPLAMGDRFDGHIVQGHVDTAGTIKNIEKDGGSKVFTIEFSKSYNQQIVPKGSITVDGVSLTVVELKTSQLSIALIPHTLKHTTLGERQVGDTVNLEFDIIAKYLARQ